MYGEEFNIDCKCRPYVEEFIEYACQNFEVIIFTASLQDYANPLLDKLDPNM